MSAALWPCQCGRPGIKNLGADGYCSEHLSDLIARFDTAPFCLNGVGLIDGRARPDFGPDYWDLRCNVCSATFVGRPVIERCTFCAALVEHLREYQGDLLLSGVDLEDDAAGFDAAVRAWGERLDRAVAVDLINRGQADRAWRREVARAIRSAA